MRTFALAFVSTLLLSPISVLATYGEHEHHSHEQDHAVSHSKGQSTGKTVTIAVGAIFVESDVEQICEGKKEACLYRNECYDEDESCGKKNKCHDKKKKCLEEYDCLKDKKVCRPKTTNRYGYRCGKKFYNQAKVLAAARASCKKIGKNPQKGSFPAVHTAYEFEKSGPYVEWPINQDGSFWRKLIKSRARLVMTMDCAVVGAVTRHKHGEYTLCKYERQ
ncbi:hypothetical protein HI914_05403 [Erysiphe necator]|nr:hypothetical protein HI914_05402 [Erysiphe necator]KAI6246088.1 hypothetical protein HI914_05403 [Erysiphe necator]